MRSLPAAYMLWFASAFGVAGLHRFYLGKPISGAAYLFTWGFFGIGLLYDLFAMPMHVDAANRKLLPPGGGLDAVPSLPAAPVPPLQLRILRAAREHDGRLTTIQAATDLGVEVAEAEAKLDELCKEGHAEIQVDDEGTIYYDFPELRFG